MTEAAEHLELVAAVRHPRRAERRLREALEAAGRRLCPERGQELDARLAEERVVLGAPLQDHREAVAGKLRLAALRLELLDGPLAPLELHRGGHRAERDHA